MLTLFIVLSAIVYRLARFVIVDAVFDGPRAEAHDWLLDRKQWWALKVHELAECWACMTVWFSAAVTFGVDIYGVSVPLPAITWLVPATGALLIAGFLDPEN